jgi:hypothetical protein
MNNTYPRATSSNEKSLPVPFNGLLILCLLALLLGLGHPYAHAVEARSTAETEINVCPASIAYGETIQCSIDSAAETDGYTISGNAGDLILARMSTTSGDLWPKIEIVDTGGDDACQAHAPQSAEIAACSLPADGDYTIRASDGFNGTHTGGYDLFIQRLNAPGNTIPIGFGQTLPGSIPTPAEMDSYTLTANAGDVLLARASNSAGEVWPDIRVYTPDGDMVCEESGPVSSEIASCTLPADGVYMILAGDGFDNSKTGDYDLFIQRLNAPGYTTPIGSRQSRSGTISVPAEMDSFTLAANAGEEFLFRITRTSGTFWPEIRVYDPDGTKLCEESGSASAEIADCTLPVDGTYTLLAGDGFDGTKTGGYTLYVRNLADPEGYAIYLPVTIK